jgi:RNA polymerase sigma factor (sigma-70 family)
MTIDELTHTDDRTATYERVFELEAERLWRALLAFTGGRTAIAEEAVAEAFARALARSEEIREPARWIYRVAMNVAVDEIRRESRLGGDAVEMAVDDPLVSDEIWIALRQLSPNQRLAVVMRYELDLDIGEIAARMGIASPTVRVHLLRGRRRLRELLGGDDDD